MMHSLFTVVWHSNTSQLKRHGTEYGKWYCEKCTANVACNAQCKTMKAWLLSHASATKAQSKCHIPTAQIKIAMRRLITWPSRPAIFVTLLPRRLLRHGLVFFLWLQCNEYMIFLRVWKVVEDSRSPLDTDGSLWISSDTGTVPVLSILSSSCSCSSSASSLSKSISSTGSPIGALIIACAISSPKACCSRSLSLQLSQYVCRNGAPKDMITYIVSSTLSILSLPCICCIASPALSIAARVSRLIFAASIE